VRINIAKAKTRPNTAIALALNPRQRYGPQETNIRKRLMTVQAERRGERAGPMKNTLKLMWRQHRLLLLAFIASVIIATLMLARLVVLIVYFSQHRDAELAGWMPLGYISRSYNIDTKVLSQSVGLPSDTPMYTSLDNVAKMQNRPLAKVEQDILDAVDAERSKQ
jgi:hypothetical protein